MILLISSKSERRGGDRHEYHEQEGEEPSLMTREQIQETPIKLVSGFGRPGEEGGRTALGDRAGNAVSHWFGPYAISLYLARCRTVTSSVERDFQRA